MDLPSRRKPKPWSPPIGQVRGAHSPLDQPILTPRTVVRPLTVEDAAAYFGLIDDNRNHLLPWLPWAATSYQTVDETWERLSGRLAEHQEDPTRPRHLGIFESATAELIGAISCNGIDAITAATDLGFLVAAGSTRQGLGREVVARVISTALRQSEAPEPGWGLNRVTFRTSGANVAAHGLLGTLGVRREMRRRQDHWVDGVGVDDTYGWGVLADEWDGGRHRMKRDERDPDVGVGPHQAPWPEGDRFDHRLLRDGDRRNVADQYRFWRHEAIVEDLVERANPFHVAIENWRHDNNIGTVVRNANAFGAAGVHIVGRRSWNRRGAMVTDRYLQIHHHDDVEALAGWAAEQDLALIGIDNLPGSVSIHHNPPPRRSVLLMGQEGPGLSEPARRAVSAILHIPQFGSTRSINAGVASGIAMAAWVRVHHS